MNYKWKIFNPKRTIPGLNKRTSQQIPMASRLIGREDDEGGFLYFGEKHGEDHIILMAIAQHLSPGDTVEMSDGSRYWVMSQQTTVVN